MLPRQVTEYRAADRSAKRSYVPRLTFVESFVGVVILALIAAILFPVFARGREIGCKRPSCQSNLKQIGLGIMQYAQDNNEEYPLILLETAGVVGSNTRMSWRQNLFPYTKNLQIFACPQRSTPITMNPIDEFPQSYDVTYTGPIGLDNPLGLEDVPTSANTIMVFEENGDTTQSQGIGVPWDYDSGEDGWTNILYAGHLGHSNYLFCDGHVKAYKPMQTVANGVNMWHLDNSAPVTPRALEKLQAAERNSPQHRFGHRSTRNLMHQKYLFLTGRR